MDHNTQQLQTLYSPEVWVIEMWLENLKEWVPSSDMGTDRTAIKRKQRAWIDTPTRMRCYVRKYR